MATPESKVKLKVKARLKEAGVWYFSPIGGRFSEHGIPDIICCKPVLITPDMVGQTHGFFIGIEAKAPGKIKNTTANQDRVLAEIRKHSGVAVVVDSADQLDGPVL